MTEIKILFIFVYHQFPDFISNWNEWFELCIDPGLMLNGSLYIVMDFLHTILHCQTPSLSVSRALVVVAHYLWVSLS